MELRRRILAGSMSLSYVMLLALIFLSLSNGSPVDVDLRGEERLEHSLQFADPWASYAVYVRDTGSGASVTIFAVNLTDGMPLSGAKLVARVSPTNVTFSAQPSGYTPGVYVISVDVSLFGAYSFNILSCVSDDTCSPISRDVYMFNVGGALSASHSFASGFSDTYTVGEIASFNITAEDSHGIVDTVIYDPCPFQVNISTYTDGEDPLNYKIVPQGQGIYTVQFVPIRVQLYFVSVTISGTAIYAGEFWFNTTLDAATAVKKFAFETDAWDNSSRVIVGEHLYSLVSTDPNYEVINNFTIQVAPSGDLLMNASVFACTDLRVTVGCSFSMNITIPGNYSVYVTLFDEPLPNSPFTVEVLPGMAVGLKSTLSVKYAGITAGQSIAYQAFLVDEYGNPASSTFKDGPDSLNLVVGLYGLLPPIIGNISVFLDNLGYPVPGKYLATFNATLTGNFTVFAYFGSSVLNSLRGSGFTLVVNPSVPSAYTSFLDNFSNFTVGSSTLMKVYLKDAYNNTVSRNLQVAIIVSKDLSSFTFPAVSTIGEHFEAVVTGIFKAGNYQVNVSVNGSSLLGGYHLHVFGGQAAPNNCSFVGLQNTEAGISSSFVLQLADEYGNAPTIGADIQIENYLRIFSPRGDDYADVQVAQFSAGLYNITYRATKALIYVVSFFVGHQQLSKEILVSPGPLDVKQCSFSGPGTIGGFANRTVNVTITPRDSYGNRLHVNDVDKLIFQVSGTVRPFDAGMPEGGLWISPVFLDLIGDAYMFSYTSQVSGIVFLTVTAENHIYVIRSTQRSGRLSVHNTFLSGMGLNGTATNKWAMFYIHAYDAFGNPKSDPGSIGEPFRAAICSENGACSTSNISITDRHYMMGQYVVSYQAPVSGNYTIYISWLGTDINGSPLVVPVVDASVSRILDPLQFVLCSDLSTPYFCPGLFGAYAGQEQSFTLMAADDQGIPLFSGGAHLLLSMSPVVVSNNTLEDAGTGDYVVRYCIFKAGSYNLTVTYNGLAVVVRQVQIAPGVTYASKCTLVVPLPVSYPVGLLYSSAIISLDMYANQQVYGPQYAYSLDQFEIVASKSTGEQVHGNVSVAGNGSVVVSIISYFAGTYNVSVLLNGELISGANQIVLFHPGAPIMSNSRISFNNWTVAGDLGIIYIFPVDAFGNELTSGLNCSASAASIGGDSFPPPYCNSSAHPVEVTYNLTKTGIYYISFNVYDSTGAGFRSTANITVKSGQPAGLNCRPVDTVFTTKTGATSNMLIDCQDLWGNTCTDDFSGLFMVSLWMNDFPPVYASVSFDGIHLVATYVLYKCGNYTSEVRFQGLNIPESSCIVTASPAPSSSSLSFALYGPNTAGKLNTSLEDARVSAGTMGLLKVVIVDMYGNRQDISVADTINVSFAPIPGVPPYISTGAYVKPVNMKTDRNSDGTCNVTFSANIANFLQSDSFWPIRYLLSVRLLGEDGLFHEISGSPFRFLVSPGLVNVAKSVLRQTESWSDVHGLMWMVTLIPKDIFGNAGPFEPTLSITAGLQGNDYFLSNGSAEGWLDSPSYDYFLQMEQFFQGAGLTMNYSTPPLIVDNYNGTFFIYFSVLKSGFYNVSIFINSALVGGPWVTITNYQVMPGPVDMRRLNPSGLGLGYNATVAGQLSAILVQFADKFGNPVDLGQDDAAHLVANLTADFHVHVWTGASFSELPDEEVVAGKNFSVDGEGLVWLFYQPLRSGQLMLDLGYRDSTTSVVEKVFGSPFYGTVEPGTILSSNCVAFGPGMRSALACNNYMCPNSSIYLEAHDSYNNFVSSDLSPSICESFTVIAGPSMSFRNAVPSNGRCLLMYTASKVSTQIIAIQYMWSPIQSSPFQVAVRPTVGDPSPRNCLASGDLGGIITAGAAATITVRLVDTNGVEIFQSPSGTANYVNLVIVNSTMGVAAADVISKDNNDGTFTLKLVAFSSGLYSFNILVGPMKMPLGGNGNGYVLRVVSGPTIISKTTASLVSSHPLYKTGKDAVVIEVQPLDGFDNFQDNVVKLSDFFVAQIMQPDGMSTFAPLTLDSAVSDKEVPYQKWVLSYIPLQSPFGGSVYSFEFFWSDGYLLETINTKISVPTSPGEPFLDHTQVIGQGAITAVAGSQATFIVQLYDEYQNLIRSEWDVLNSNVTVVLSISNVPIKVNCSYLYAPTGLTCNYTVAESGNYSLKVAFNLTEYKSFPNVTVGPAPVYPPYCTASGDGVGEGAPIYAGVPVKFAIQPYDMFGNRIFTGGDSFSVVLDMYNDSGDSYLSPSSVYPKWTGTEYEVYYTPMQAGYGVVHVRRGLGSILNSPFHIHVNPGPVSAEHCVVRPSSFSSCMAGDMHSITLVSFDQYGNIRPTVTDWFEISKHVEYAPSESDIATMGPLGNGVYQYVYMCQHAGTVLNMNCTTITVRFGESIVLSTKLRVIPGPADISKCTVILKERILVAGSVGSVVVVSRDSFDNQLWVGGLDFLVFVTINDINSTVKLVDNEDGTYLFMYAAMTSGNYTVQASFGGQVFFRDYVEVFPGPPDSFTSIVTFDSGGYASNEVGKFQIQVFDKFSNAIMADVLDTSLLLVTLMTSTFPSFAWYPESNISFTGTLYEVRFLSQHPGVIRLSLNISNEMLLNFSSSAPYSAVVGPGLPFIPNFALFGPGIDAGGIVNSPATFYVHMRDSEGNLITNHPHGSWSLSFSPINVVPVRPAPFFLLDGTVMFTYIPVRPAVDLAITVLYRGQKVGSVRYVKVKARPGFWSLKSCAALDSYGVPIHTSKDVTASVGMNLTINLQVRDKDGMDIPAPDPTLLTFQATVSGVPVSVAPTSSGLYGFTITDTVSKRYVIEVTDGVQFIQNSGFIVNLLPGPSHPLNTQILTSDGLHAFDPSTALVAGEETILMLQAYDAYGNRQVFNILNSPDIFSAALQLLPSKALFNSYISLYDIGVVTKLHIFPYLSGDYLLSVTVNGAFARTLSLHVKPAAFDFSCFEIFPSKLPIFYAGVESGFELIPKDSYLNTFDGAAVWGDICVELQPTDGSTSIRALISPQVNSTAILVSFTLSLAGSYTIVASNATSKITGNLQKSDWARLETITVLAGPIEPSSLVTALPSVSNTAGNMVMLHYTAFDSFGNANYSIPQVMTSPPYWVEVTSPCSWDAGGQQSCDLHSFSTAFLPTMPGTVNMSLMWGEMVLQTTVDILPASSPQLLSAKLSDSLAHVIVLFDSDTDGGSQNGTFSSTGCSTLFNSSLLLKLGTNPSCTFQDLRTLLIFLGHNASILPADSESPDFIGLLDNSVYGAGANSFPVTGSVVLMQPDAPIAPKARLVAPTSLSPCDALVLDASDSSGSGGRPLIFEYSVQGTGDQGVLVAITQWLNEVPSSTMTVVLSANMLQAGQKYTFIVTVMNFIGVHSRSSITVRTMHVPVPLLTIPVADGILYGTRGQLFEIEAVASLPSMAVQASNGSCSPALLSAQKPTLLYEWSQTSGPILDFSSIIWKARVLSVRGDLLEAGYVYNFTVRCSMQGFPMSFSEAGVALAAESSSLSVAIIGGNRTVDSSQNATLEVDAYDADYSVDLNGQSLQFRYSWTCDPDLGVNASPLYESSTSNGFGRKITIPGGYLADGTYNFSVSVDKEPLVAGRIGVTAWVLVTAGSHLSTVTAVIENAALVAQGIDRSKQLKVSCSDGLYHYRWSIWSAVDQRDLVNSESVLAVSHHLLIPANTLLGGTSYMVSCNASNKLGHPGSANITIDTVRDPTGGSVILSTNSESDIAGQTLYNLIAYDWTPGQGIGVLKYEFRYILEGGMETVIQPLSLTNLVENVAVKAGNVTFRVYIANPTSGWISAGDAPQGALYELPPITVSASGDSTFSSLQDENALYNSFQTLHGQGEYLQALNVMEVFGSLHIFKGAECYADSSVVPLVNDMLTMIAASDSQYPSPYVSDTTTAGTGPSIAIALACALGEIFKAPGNVDAQGLNTSFSIFEDKLTVIAAHHLSAAAASGQPYNPCFFDAVDGLLSAVHSSCTPTPESLARRASRMPLSLAHILLNDNAFNLPSYVVRPSFSLAAASVDLGASVTSNLTASVANFQVDISILSGTGTAGAAIACFSMLAPLNVLQWTTVDWFDDLVAVHQVCDFTISGILDNAVTAVVSFVDLLPPVKNTTYAIAGVSGEDGSSPTIFYGTRYEDGQISVHVPSNTTSSRVLLVQIVSGSPGHGTAFQGYSFLLVAAGAFWFL